MARCAPAGMHICGPGFEVWGLGSGVGLRCAVWQCGRCVCGRCVRRANSAVLCWCVGRCYVGSVVTVLYEVVCGAGDDDDNGNDKDEDNDEDHAVLTWCHGYGCSAGYINRNGRCARTDHVSRRQYHQDTVLANADHAVVDWGRRGEGDRTSMEHGWKRCDRVFDGGAGSMGARRRKRRKN
eukprot:3426881-Rhodomonas_salina.5